MKSFNLIKSVFFISLFSFLFSSCGEDGLVTPEAGPKVDFVAGTNIITSDASVGIGENFTVNLVGTKGDGSMTTILINEAGTKVNLDRLTVAGLSSFGNPISLSNDLRSSFDFKITVKAHTDVSTKAYTFEVNDDNGNKTTKTINITTTGTPPNITKPSGNLSTDTEPNTLILTNFAVSKGTSNLKSIEFFINNVKATDLSKIFINTIQTPIISNPYVLPASDKENFNKDIVFITPDQVGTYIYTIKFIDESGLSSSRDFTAFSGKKATVIEGILLNKAGVEGTGGLDLDTGLGTGSADSKAEIRDEGIVNDLTDQTWKQQISGVLGSEIKYLKKGQNGLLESFDFNNVIYKEEIPKFWSNGTAFTEKSADNRLISNKVAIGDVFTVKDGDNYYMIRIKDIKVTTNDNKDQYIIDVKY